MNLKTYIASGILELYVLNMLDQPQVAEVEEMLSNYPELQAEVLAISTALETAAFKHAVEPSDGLFAKIEQHLFGSSDAGNDSELSIIDDKSDYTMWLDLVKVKFPAALTASNFCEPIVQSQGLTQMLVVSSFDIEEESHAHEYESFLILKGKCRCTVEGQVFYLEAGGFTQIPLEVIHKVEVIDGPVMAIVQYRAAV